MRQRPQYLVAAFAQIGHPAYFVDPRISTPRQDDGVAVVPDLTHVPATGVILYVHFAPLRELFDRFDDPVVVYDILDDLSIYEANEEGMPEGRRVRAHHPGLMATADLVMASSPALVERHAGERNDEIPLVRNGVDPDRFSRPAPRPADLPPADPDRPLVGYNGGMAPWVDFDLLEGVAKALPGWDFVLVGHVDPQAASDVARVGRLPNVTVLGERPGSSMPAYAQAYDIGTVWFAVTHLTKAVTPVKLYEYLAAGTPVVGTPLPACEAEPLVHTAGDVPGFVAALEAARADANSAAFAARALRTAREHSWENSLRPVMSRLAERGLDRVPR